MPQLEGKDALLFKALLQGHVRICSHYNDQCNKQYSHYLNIHKNTLIKDDNGKKVQPTADLICEWIAVTIEFYDVALYQLLDKKNKTNEHKMICGLFAKATYDGRCPAGVNCQ